MSDEHLEQVAHAEARRRHQAGVGGAVHLGGVAEGAEGQEQQHEHPAEHVIELEVRRLEHLPGPLAAQVVLQVLVQRVVAGEEVEPGDVRTHVTPTPPLRFQTVRVPRPTSRIENTKTDMPSANGSACSLRTRTATQTIANSAVILSKQPGGEREPLTAAAAAGLDATDGAAAEAGDRHEVQAGERRADAGGQHAVRAPEQPRDRGDRGPQDQVGASDLVECVGLHEVFGG